MKYIKKKCDYTCGWCAEDEKCVDRATYIDCSKLDQVECIQNAQFYSTRCKKSCNWCNAIPAGLWKQWSLWTKCLPTCGPGIRMRSRQCLSNSCQGDTAEVTRCEIKKCPSWNDWTTWSKCNGSCGSGLKTRERVCPPGATCLGVAIETKKCTLIPCPVNGIVFGKWTECSRSCGGGTRKKISFCPAPDPATCPNEFEDCNTHNCPVKTCYEHRYGSAGSACCGDHDEVACTRARRRIIGGTVVKPKQFAWMARLEYLTGRVGAWRTLLCGGTLIHQMFVLTAAHCLEGVVDANRLQVLLGAISRYDTSTLTQRKLVENFTMHPDYDTITTLNDIALIKLKSRATMTSYVTTLCLPEKEETIIDTACFVAGWGLTDSQRPISSPNLMEAKVRYLPFKICQDGHRASQMGPHMNSSSMMCAGIISGGFDTCRGDSGGPLMCQRCSSCSWYITGITSFGAVNCGVANVPAVYTRVTYYEDWVNEVVMKDDPLGVVCMNP